MYIIARRCPSQEITISSSHEVFYITDEVCVCVRECIQTHTHIQARARTLDNRVFLSEVIEHADFSLSS